MAGFQILKDVCANFDAHVEQISLSLFSARIVENLEEHLTKKLQDFDVFTTKYRLLNAKTTALTPDIVERVKNGANVIDDYEDVVQDKIVERALVKSAAQQAAVRKLLATPDRKLVHDDLARKEQILERIKEFNSNEIQLRELDAVLTSARSERAGLRQAWDEQLGHMRQLKSAAAPENHLDTSGPLYEKLKTLVTKMEMMSWLIGRLVTANTGRYDWLSDPKDLLACLSLTRDAHTHSVQHFIQQ